MKLRNCFLVFVFLVMVLTGANAESEILHFPVMRPDAETIQRWVDDYESAPRTVPGKQAKTIKNTRINLLSYLNYIPAEHNQGLCGNCWVWAGTGTIGIALRLQENISDRLSVQYASSCNTYKHYCEGGWVSDFVKFYNKTKIAIPWSNMNAHWQGGDGQGSTTMCQAIDKSKSYQISSIQDVTIETQSVDQSTAIQNIKNVLDQKKAVMMGYMLPEQSDWDRFWEFWSSDSSETLVRLDDSCGKPYKSGGGAHMVLIVGYDASDANPENHYWIVLNSWGTTAKRSSGIFRVKMNMAYDCTFLSSGNAQYSLYFQTLDVFFDAPGSIEGTVTDAITSKPVSGVSITAVSPLGFETVQTDKHGEYRFVLNNGVYDLSLEKYGYQSAKINDVIVTPGKQLTQKNSIVKKDSVTVSGFVKDSQTSWPLFSEIEIAPEGYDETITVYNDPASGKYEVDLLPGLGHTLTVRSLIKGYASAGSDSVNPMIEGTSLDFTLKGGKEAPGYSENGYAPKKGSLVVGRIIDSETKKGLSLAWVLDGKGGTSGSLKDPDKPENEAGFYYVFVSSKQTITVKKQGYSHASKKIKPVDGTLSFIKHDFGLTAARVAVAQSGINLELNQGEQSSVDLTISNQGDVDATFSISEVNILSTTASKAIPPIGLQNRVVQNRILPSLSPLPSYGFMKREADVAWGMKATGAKTKSAGTFFQNWSFGSHVSTGLGINKRTGDVLIYFPESRVHKKQALYEFHPNGNQSGRSKALPDLNGSYMGDMAYDHTTGMIWQINIALPDQGNHCIYEIDPTSLLPTGNKICPDFKEINYGLAHNPVTDYFYAGSKDIRVFDRTGRIIKTISAGLNIVGLAFNPETNHIFALDYHGKKQGNDIYVYGIYGNLLSKIDIEFPANDASMIGLDIDCNGHLWMMNAVSWSILEVDSGEPGSCPDIPWAVIDGNATGTIEPGAERNVAVDIDTTGMNPGDYSALIRVDNNTPYGSDVVPVHLTVIETGITPDPESPRDTNQGNYASPSSEDGGGCFIMGAVQK